LVAELTTYWGRKETINISIIKSKEKS